MECLNAQLAHSYEGMEIWSWSIPLPRRLRDRHIQKLKAETRQVEKGTLISSLSGGFLMETIYPYFTPFHSPFEKENLIFIYDAAMLQLNSFK